jgi:hypothetical protein
MEFTFQDPKKSYRYFFNKMISTLYRISTAFGPPTVEKNNSSALKFGILGAAQIA